MLNAINSLFNNLVARKIFLKLRWVLGVVALVVFAYVARADLLCAGFVVSMFGQAIQFWCFGSLVKNKELTARGPYVMVRNPMYLGRYFLILGFVVVTGSVWVVIVYTVIYWFYMANRVQREEVKLAELLGEPYRTYCANTNRFLPNFLKIADPMVRFFSFPVLTSNNGHWNALATLVAWAVLYSYLVYLR